MKLANLKTVLTKNWHLLLLVGLVLLPDALLHTVLLDLPQGVSRKSSLTNLAVVTLGGGLLALLTFKIFGRKVLIALFFVNLLVSAVVATFYNAFHHVPSYRILFQNITEGIAVADAIWIFFPFWFVILGIACGVGGLLIGRRADRNVRPALLVAGGVMAVMLHAVLAFRVDPSVYLISNTPNNITHRHGFYLGQLYDMAWSASQPMSAMAEIIVADAADHPVPRLDVVGPGLLASLDSVLLIQVESLDWDVINRIEYGAAVTPFLNGLARDSTLMKLKANHSGSAGSAGSDFQVLTGLRPSKSTNIYLDRGFSWNSRLPQSLVKNGFSFEMIHGNDSAFLHRESAYRAMGVTQFRDPRSVNMPPDTSWGWSDQLLFQQALKAIEADGAAKSVKMIITLSSHTPFNFVANGFGPGDDVKSRYLNSINYADRQLAAFVGRLKGRHLLVVWGDHESGALSQPGRQRAAEGEYVPGFVFAVNDGAIVKLTLSADERHLLSGKFEIASLNSLVVDFATRGNKIIAQHRTPTLMSH